MAKVRPRRDRRASAKSARGYVPEHALSEDPVAYVRSHLPALERSALEVLEEYARDRLAALESAAPADREHPLHSTEELRAMADYADSALREIHDASSSGIERPAAPKTGAVLRADPHSIAGHALSALVNLVHAREALEVSTARAATALAEAQEHYGIAFHEWYVWQRYERRWGLDRDVGRKVRAGGEKGGGTRGRAWVPLALERASTMWKGEPTLSAHEVARQIYLGLPDSPKSDTVRREISRLKPRTTPLGR